MEKGLTKTNRIIAEIIRLNCRKCGNGIRANYLQRRQCKFKYEKTSYFKNHLLKS